MKELKKNPFILLTAMCDYCSNWFCATQNSFRIFLFEQEEAPDYINIGVGSEFLEWIPEGFTPDFIDLHDRIHRFTNNEDNNKTTISGENWENTSYSKDLKYTSWQTAFAEELNMYKRAKFI